MKDFTPFNDKVGQLYTTFSDVAGTPSRIGSLDPKGSTVDSYFSEAIVANEPTTVLEEKGIIRVFKIPDEVDNAIIPVQPISDLTWKRIGRDSQDTGSEFGASVLTTATFVKITPEVRTANIFLPDNVILFNKTNFDYWANFVAISAKKQKEQEGLGSLTTESKLVNIYSATAGTSAGSINAGSKLVPMDLSRMKRVLSSGSFITKPDFALIHPNQYFDLITSAEFTPGYATAGAAMMPGKARWENGDLVWYDGMDIIQSELIPSAGSTTVSADVTNNLYTVLGHPAIVGKRGQCLARVEHVSNYKVTTQDDRLRHGQYKIIDMDYGYDVLVGSSLALIRCAG